MAPSSRAPGPPVGHGKGLRRLPTGTRRVVGYYALAAGSVAHDGVPPRTVRGLGRYPIPVILLTPLGVDVGAQGRGLGSALVRDALLQTAAIADRAGVRALLIHAETPEAAEFYRRIDPGFEPHPQIRSISFSS